jgi:hypothetical protein
MINFPCTCGHRFSFPDEEAGGMAQCPACKRLVDVPIPGDLVNFEEDGTLKMEIPFRDDEEDRIAELTRAYLPRRQDEHGEDYDLRVTMEQIEAAGSEEIPLELKDEVKPGAPKYDPETGELIRPMALKEDEYKKVIPLPPQQTLHYQQADPMGADMPLWKAPLALLRHGSLAVMLILFGFHLLSNAMWSLMGIGLLLAVIVDFFIWAMMPAHYANVVEELGPLEKDEIPTPLRGMAFMEDVIWPFLNFIAAIAICYGPAVWAYEPNPGGRMAGLAVAGLGTIMFPAVFLTLCTSGSVLNLRPDRVFSVVAKSGGRYLFATILWTVAVPGYLTGIFLTSWFATTWLTGRSMGGPWYLPMLGYTLVLGGIFLMHYFCVALGLIYRKHHNDFPWVLQRHEASKKWQEYVARRKPRYVQKRAGGAVAPSPVAQQHHAKPVQQPVQAIPQQPMRVLPVESARIEH